MSVEYYAKLERGALGGVSAAVLDAIARALQLDDAERAHLFDLARAADGIHASAPPPSPRRPAAGAAPSLQWALDAITDGPGVRPQRPHGPARHQRARPRVLRTDVFDDRGRTGRTSPGSTFLDPARRATSTPTGTWPPTSCVAILRTEAGRDPHDKDLHDLVGELSTRSDDFRTRWGAHDVRPHGTGTKRFHHPVVGDLTLAYEGTRHDRRTRPHPHHLHRRTRLAVRRTRCACSPPGPPPPQTVGT